MYWQWGANNTDSEWDYEALFAESQKEKFVRKEGKYKQFSIEAKKARLGLEKLYDWDGENMRKLEDLGTTRPSF